MVNPLSGLKPALEVLARHRDILPATGQAMEDLMHPGQEEVEDEILNGDTLQADTLIESPRLHSQTVWRPLSQLPHLHPRPDPSRGGLHSAVAGQAAVGGPDGLAGGRYVGEPRPLRWGGERVWTTKCTKEHEIHERARKARNVFVYFAAFRGLRDPNPLYLTGATMSTPGSASKQGYHFGGLSYDAIGACIDVQRQLGVHCEAPL